MILETVVICTEFGMACCEFVMFGEHFVRFAASW